MLTTGLINPDCPMAACSPPDIIVRKWTRLNETVFSCLCTISGLGPALYW